VPKQPDARCSKIDSTLTGARRLASMDLGESTSRLILLTRVLRIRPVVMITLPGALAVGVLDRQTYQRGTRGSRLCGEDRDRETENSKVCTRTRDTRFIHVRAAKVVNPTSCLGDQVWRPVLGVGLFRCPTRYPTLLYIVLGQVPSRLQGRSPSRITGEF
jgi:hypothetical protein